MFEYSSVKERLARDSIKGSVVSAHVALKVYPVRRFEEQYLILYPMRLKLTLVHYLHRPL